MSRLCIRERSHWITFIGNKEELVDFEVSIIPGRCMVIGDIALFNQTMMLMLLKMLEEHPGEVDCYSSIDISDPVLLSRFSEVRKEPLVIESGDDIGSWATVKHDYIGVEGAYGSASTIVKLRLPLVSSQFERLLINM